MSSVIDTNVLCVADGLADQAGPGCVTRCVRALEQAVTGVVSVDSGGQLIIEYLTNVSKTRPYGARRRRRGATPVRSAAGTCVRDSRLRQGFEQR
ncbi:MAG: hypothetical protein ACRD0K_17015 [Egibacteraceae bacterium]